MALNTRAAVIVVLVVLAGRPASAQPAEPDLPAAGQRVRVTLRSTEQRLVATVVATSPDGLTLRPASSSQARELRWTDMRELRVSRGVHRHTVKGLLAGAAAWAATVGLMAAFSTLDESGLGEPLVIGGFLTTGAVAGSLIRTEGWKEVPLSSVGGVASASRPGLRLQVTVGF